MFEIPEYISQMALQMLLEKYTTSVDLFKNSAIRFEPFQGDGSTRRFFRIWQKDLSLCVAVYPDDNEERGLSESRSAVSIGGHLLQKGIPVPSILGWDKGSGLVLFEDCGRKRLHDTPLYHSDLASSSEAADVYCQVVDLLCLMQVRGAEEFDVNWCYDGSYYDRDVMVPRESDYFYTAFWLELFGGKERQDVNDEFEDIAKNAAHGMDNQFLHRDFQSRNVMINPAGELRIIDYQAGRLGPPGYDLASLLIDPYAGLPCFFQETLLARYIEELSSYIDFDERLFRHQYEFLALQRNMQILGAFSFLYRQRGKLFFKAFIRPALDMLAKRLAVPTFSQYTELRSIVDFAARHLKI